MKTSGQPNFRSAPIASPSPPATEPFSSETIFIPRARWSASSRASKGFRQRACTATAPGTRAATACAFSYQSPVAQMARRRGEVFGVEGVGVLGVGALPRG